MGTHDRCVHRHHDGPRDLLAVGPACRAGVPVAGSIPAGAVQHLQFSLTLPNQNETTINGTLPTGTIQGLVANLTWTFTQAQRTATTTNS